MPADKIATIVDEVPVLALVAAHARGVTVFREVSELRVKETDRLAAIVEGLRLSAWTPGSTATTCSWKASRACARPSACIRLEERPPSGHDLGARRPCGNAPVEVENFDSVKTSYPQFLTDIERLAR